MADSRPTRPARPAEDNHNRPVSEHLLARFDGTGNPTVLQASSPVGHTLPLPVPDSRATTPGPPVGNPYSRPMSPNPWEVIQAPSAALPLPVPGSRATTPGPPAGHIFHNPISENESFQVNGNANIGNPTIRQHIVVMTPNDLQQTLQSQYIQESKECLQSLHFKEMTSRKHLITEKCDGTCEWLLQHAKYRTWMDKARGILWMTGMPGSGKSTLLKYAQETEKSSLDCTMASFFFSRSGTQMQRNALGLFRSLLHQLFTQNPQLLDGFLPTFRVKLNTKGKPGEDWEWHKEELQKFFKSCIALKGHRILIFIDALDECTEDDLWELVEYFKTLTTSTDSALRICFSCRHVPCIGPSDDDDDAICVQKENNDDILTYIRANLRHAFNEDQKVDDIRTKISGKAEGSFQWVELAVERTLSFQRKGKSVTKILSMLEQIPQALDGLYRQILENIDKEERSEALHLVQWVCLAARPLALTELRFAMASDWVDPRQRLHQNHGQLEKSEDYENDAQMERLLKNLSGGLVEVKREGQECTVQLIHQSVNDFLIRSGGIQILDGSKNIRHSIGQGHHRMARACIDYATLADVHLAVRTGPVQQFPFLTYAVTSWVWHAEQAEANGISQHDLPERFQGPFGGNLERWIDAYRAVDPGSEECPDKQTNLLHVTSKHGILSAVKALSLGAAFNVNSVNSKKRTPLSYAAENGYGEVVETLLETGADASLEDVKARTPLWYAIMNGNERVVKLLLNNGIDTDSTKYTIQKCLCYAARNGYKEVVRVLLEKGVDVNSKDRVGRTLLSHAAGKGHTGLVTLLLENAADVNPKDDYLRTPLSSATDNGHDEVVDLLLRQEADVESSDFWGRTPLSLAADNGHAAVVALLLAENADVGSRDQKGRTPLWYAVYNGHEPVVELLHKHSADKNAGQMPLL